MGKYFIPHFHSKPWQQPFLLSWEATSLPLLYLLLYKVQLLKKVLCRSVYYIWEGCKGHGGAATTLAHNNTFIF